MSDEILGSVASLRWISYDIVRNHSAKQPPGSLRLGTACPCAGLPPRFGSTCARKTRRPQRKSLVAVVV